MRTILGAGLTVLMLASCAGSQTAVPAIDDHRERPSPSPSPTPSLASEQPTPPAPDPLPSLRESAAPESRWEDPECGDGSWGAYFSIVDAALGTRWLALRVINCSESELVFPRPAVEGFDGDGAPMGLTTDISTYAGMPTLHPDEAITLEMTWLSNGRCERGAQSLILTLDDQEFSPDDDCLQLGGSYAPDRDTDISIRLASD